MEGKTLDAEATSLGRATWFNQIRKESNKGGPRRKSAILTDTTVKKINVQKRNLKENCKRNKREKIKNK